AQTLGKVRLSWVRSSDANVVGYQVYRSSSAFAQVSEAVRAHAGNLGASVNSHEDLPATGGNWFYRVWAVNAAGTLSEPSNQVQAVSDAEAPRATAIVYTALGK